MFDNDTKEKVYTGVRASNTHETLKPRDIFEASGDSRPVREEDLKPAPLSEQIKRFLQPTPKEAVYAPEGFKKPEVNLTPIPVKPEPYRAAPKPIVPHFGSIGNLVLPASKPAELKPMDERVLRLEEQVDGLLERLARFNFKASHKI